MIIVGPMTAIAAAKRGFGVPGGPPLLVFLTIPLFDILVFAILIVAGLYYRQRPDVHKRLMLLSTISILPSYCQASLRFSSWPPAPWPCSVWLT
jgi:hypothetical protein